MQQIIFAMFAAGLFLAVRDMAKVFLKEKEKVWIREMPQDRLMWVKAEAFRTLSEDFLGQEEEVAAPMTETVWETFKRRACDTCQYRVNCEKVGRIGRKRYAASLIRLMD